jgi:hypothetical protein
MPGMSVPPYDEEAARLVDDWADVPGAPDALHDVPTRCIFCRKFIAITDSDPTLVITRTWRQPSGGGLYAAHAECLEAHAESSRTR